MLGLLQSISGWIEVAYDYLLSSIKGFGYMIGIVIQSLAIPPLLRPYLPSFLGIAVTCVICIAVIKAIFGR